MDCLHRFDEYFVHALEKTQAQASNSIGTNQSHVNLTSKAVNSTQTIALLAH